MCASNAELGQSVVLLIFIQFAAAFFKLSFHFFVYFGNGRISFLEQPIGSET